MIPSEIEAEDELATLMHSSPSLGGAFPSECLEREDSWRASLSIWREAVPSLALEASSSSPQNRDSDLSLPLQTLHRTHSLFSALASSVRNARSFHLSAEIGISVEHFTAKALWLGSYISKFLHLRSQRPSLHVDMLRRN